MHRERQLAIREARHQEIEQAVAARRTIQEARREHARQEERQTRQLQALAARHPSP
jgi:hypothetical protein